MASVSESLVTGHSGFIGQHLVSCLLRDKQRVIFFDGNTELMPDLERVFRSESFYKIFHMAGRVPRYNRISSFDKRDYKANIKSVSNIAILCLKARKHVVFPSSIAVNGPSDIDITEESPLQPATLYGNSKLACERVLLDLIPKKCTIFRIGNVYGSLSTRGELIESLIRAGLSGAPVKVNLNPNSERDFIHVTDVVSAMLKSSESAKTLCIGTGEGIGIRALVEVIGQVLNTRIQVNFAEGAPRDRFVVNPSKLQSEIDFKPRVSLEDGIRETAEWVRKTNGKKQTN